VNDEGYKLHSEKVQQKPSNSSGMATIWTADGIASTISVYQHFLSKQALLSLNVLWVNHGTWI